MGTWWQDEQKRENKKIQKLWEKSKDIKYAVSINWSGGLKQEVIEIRFVKDCQLGDDGYYWSKDMETTWQKGLANPYPDEISTGFKLFIFDKRRDAECFLQGATAFKQFMSQFFK